MQILLGRYSRATWSAVPAFETCRVQLCDLDNVLTDELLARKWWRPFLLFAFTKTHQLCFQKRTAEERSGKQKREEQHSQKWYSKEVLTKLDTLNMRRYMHRCNLVTKRRRKPHRKLVIYWSTMSNSTCDLLQMDHVACCLEGQAGRNIAFGEAYGIGNPLLMKPLSNLQAISSGGWGPNTSDYPVNHWHSLFSGTSR